MKAVRNRLYLAGLMCSVLINAGCRKTILSENFNRAEFNRVTIGESVDSVLKRLGAPLRIVKFSSEPTSLPTGEPYEVITLADVPTVVTQKQFLISFKYSLQANARRDYHRYEISFILGKVVDISNVVVHE